MIEPIVVYHAAGMGNYQSVVREQMLLLRDAGLHEIRLSHVGDGLEWIVAEAARHDVKATVIRSDPNVMHFETFAMLEIERLAKQEMVNRPILYFHTKGVSCPDSKNKRSWRRVMGNYVVSKWRENVTHLETHDAAGFNFWFHNANHFSGTFWIANADWLRKLPDYVQFHHAGGLNRYSAELWIGSAPGIRAYSHGCNDQGTWYDENYDYSPYLPVVQPPRFTITWVTAATSAYAADMDCLVKSTELLEAGHKILPVTLEDVEWKHCIKHRVLRDVLPKITTSHVFWIDADCEFLTNLRPEDFIDETKPITAVRHLAYGNPLRHLPARFHDAIEDKDSGMYWQACLFGGTVAGMRYLLDQLEWMMHDRYGYDEHGLNIELNKIPELVHTLPCRYACPATFWNLQRYESLYHERSGGAARVLHRNREINR